VLETGVIRLKVDPAEVSNIKDFAATGLDSSDIDADCKTSVDSEGESLVLAGLFRMK
jgi:hypothetical protein